MDDRNIEDEKMPRLQVRRIHHAAADAVAQLSALRNQLSLQADVVSPRGKALTEKIFGAALAPAQVVERICDDVRARGTAAVVHYTEQLDGSRLTPDDLRVDAAELADAHAAAD